MPDDEKAGDEHGERKATENVLMQKFGPLPLIVWVAVGAGILGAIIYMSRKGKSSTQAVPVAAAGIPGTQGPSDSPSSSAPDLSGTVADLQSQIGALGKTVADQNAAITQNETSLATGIANVGQQVQSSNSSLGQQINGLSGRVDQVQANGVPAGYANLHDYIITVGNQQWAN